MRDDSTDTIRLTELFCARDEEALRETARCMSRCVCTLR